MIEPSVDGSPSFLTPLDALIARAATDPYGIAIVDDDDWTWARLANESARMAVSFHKRGVAAGDRVALHMVNRVEAVLSYLACWRVGAIAVPLNTRFKPAEVASMMERIKPVLLLGEAALVAQWSEVSSELLPPKGRFVVGLGEASADAQPWGALFTEDAPLEDTPVQVGDAAAVAVLLATSGTTGASKLVAWSTGTLAALVRSASARGLSPDDIIPLALPLMHAAGVNWLADALLTGARILLVRRFDPDVILDLISTHQGTTFGGLPFMCAELAQTQAARPRPVGSLRRILSAGDVCPPATEQLVNRCFGLPLLSLWAASEEIAAGLPAAEPGPLTRFTPDAEVRLVDSKGQPVSDDEPGELWIRSPSTAVGYWCGPGEIELLEGGWFRTGDLLRQEPNGHYRYLGRLKDLIVRGGSNISPVEVEAVFRQQDGVADVAVAALPDEALGERVGAALVMADGSTVSVPTILSGVRAVLAEYKIPETVVVVDTIPRTPAAKVDRKAVAAKILESTTAAAPVVP